jgi:hypothetical protein
MADKLPYQVSWSSEARSAVREVLREARSPEARAELLQAIRTLDEQLHLDPCSVGDVFRVIGVIEKRFIVTQSLYVDFAVDTQRRLVWVRSCQGLWRGNGWLPH